MDNEQLIELTAEIVSAHVANNNVAVGDVANLVQRVHEALSSLTGQTAEAPQEKTPVVSVRASIKPDYLVCMECGRKQKTLKRHLQSAHGMSPDEYRTDYGLPADYPMVAAEYSNRRRAMAQASGLGRKPDGESSAAPKKPASGGRGKSPRARASANKSATN